MGFTETDLQYIFVKKKIAIKVVAKTKAEVIEKKISLEVAVKWEKKRLL